MLNEKQGSRNKINLTFDCPWKAAQNYFKQFFKNYYTTLVTNCFFRIAHFVYVYSFLRTKVMVS